MTHKMTGTTESIIEVAQMQRELNVIGSIIQLPEIVQECKIRLEFAEHTKGKMALVTNDPLNSEGID